MNKTILPLTLAALTLTPVFPAQAGSFKLTSPDLKDGGTLPVTHVYDDFGCTGGNMSPALAWENPPKETKSFALTVYDPDAPTGSGWWHWVVYNLPAGTIDLERGAGKPDGSAKMPGGAVQARTDFGAAGYGGACPPKGDKPHRYIFTLYALDIPTLQVPPDASPAMIGFNLNAHKMDTATLTVTYGR